MFSSERLKNFCYTIATLGSLGEWWLGGVIASAFAIPLLFLFRSLFWIRASFFYWLLVVSLVACVLVVHFALRAKPEIAKDSIVLDKIVGVMIALAGVSLRWRIVIFGLILFHVLNTLRPFWFYRSVVRHIERIPGSIGVFGADLLSGALVNVFLHLITWVMS
jgi:phosphatidylglycerophosphatase A